MARVLSTATVLALLAATALAFALTERAKLEKSPLGNTRVDQLFSPRGARGHRRASISVKVKKSEEVSVWVQDAKGNRVTTLLDPRPVRANTTLHLAWNGISDAGTRVPDGVYKPVVALERSHRTIVLPSPITVDTKSPRITVPKQVHAIISPDGDGHHDVFVVHYRVSKPAHGILWVRVHGADHRVEFTLHQKLTGDLIWNGKVAGNRVRPGVYVVSVSAEDRAGNDSKPYAFGTVQVRYLTLARDRLVVRPGATFALRVSTDAPHVTWTLHGRRGVAPRGTLRIRAPKTAGTYHLYVHAAGHAAQCTVVVR